MYIQTKIATLVREYNELLTQRAAVTDDTGRVGLKPRYSRCCGR